MSSISNINNNLKIKVVYGRDVRLFRDPIQEAQEQDKYSILLEFISSRFSLEKERLNSEFYFYFIDDEGDNVTISCNSEFEDAYQIAVEEQRKSLKIFVQKKK
jgi:hypothetical protein